MNSFHNFTPSSARRATNWKCNVQNDMKFQAYPENGFEHFVNTMLSFSPCFIRASRLGRGQHRRVAGALALPGSNSSQGDQTEEEPNDRKYDRSEDCL